MKYYICLPIYKDKPMKEIDNYSTMSYHGFDVPIGHFRHENDIEDATFFKTKEKAEELLRRYYSKFPNARVFKVLSEEELLMFEVIK